MIDHPTALNVCVFPDHTSPLLQRPLFLSSVTHLQFCEAGRSLSDPGCHSLATLLGQISKRGHGEYIKGRMSGLTVYLCSLTRNFSFLFSNDGDPEL